MKRVGENRGHILNLIKPQPNQLTNRKGEQSKKRKQKKENKIKVVKSNNLYSIKYYYLKSNSLNFNKFET